MTTEKPTPRSRVRRIPERGRYDRETINAVLDAGFVCHVGYLHDGQPYVTPTLYWRQGDHVYWHGARASRMLRTLAQGAEVCLTVAHVDGFVLARSAFHHSINYRSVMLFGTAQAVEEEQAKAAALEAFMERLFPGRWQALRPMTPQELHATTVLHLPIAEGSAKIRTGPPKDDDADCAWPVWAGVLPVQTVLGHPLPATRLPAQVTDPAYLRHLPHLNLDGLE
jgi:nitroimidazol reductase NimA-like FMN-containing flavoprotein (pyridoxamine 5'-phosphate oxidase superfamily)